MPQQDRRGSPPRVPATRSPVDEIMKKYQGAHLQFPKIGFGSQTENLLNVLLQCVTQDD